VQNFELYYYIGQNLSKISVESIYGSAKEGGVADQTRAAGENLFFHKISLVFHSQNRAKNRPVTVGEQRAERYGKSVSAGVGFSAASPKASAQPLTLAPQQVKN